MTNFCHSNIILSFEDEDEWDEVDHFPYRKILDLCILLIKLANVVPVATAAGYKTHVVLELISQLDDSCLCYLDYVCPQGKSRIHVFY